MPNLPKTASEAPTPPPQDPDASADEEPPSTRAHSRRRSRPILPLRSRTTISAMPVSEAANRLRRQYWPDATRAEWNDWRWQIRNRIRSLDSLERVFVLSEAEREAVRRHTGSLPVGITPYYASLMDRQDPAEPLRRTHVPTTAEFLRLPGEADDPLGEDCHTVVPGLVHRYPDRVLFLATPFCSTYCRYCTRARMVGETGEYSFGVGAWTQALAYLEDHTEVRDVLISGGDPLALRDEKLDWLLERLRRIRHIDFVRIGTKMPAVLPMRVTRELTGILRRHRVWMSIHFTHPRELTPEVATACDRLADAGIPLGSQTVLLKGINDDLATMRELMHGLLKNRVRPYYIYQCDPISGSGHFRTTVEKGLEIIQGLRGHTTGYAVPTFVVDAPGGGGKIPLIPDPLVGREGDDLLLRNFEGNVFRYRDAGGTLGRDASRR